jgi:glutathione S-transferase
MASDASAGLHRDAFYRFYASEVSYYSAKVRPALRYKRIPYVEILPTLAVQREVIRRRTGLGMIPVVVTPADETLQDSSAILDALEERFPDPPLYPSTPLQSVVGYLVELYADEFLIMPGLHYRWSFPESEAKARADFAASTGDADSAGRFADQVKLYVQMVGVGPATAPAIEAHTHELLAILSEHLGHHPYLLGGRPSLGDCGLIGPLYPHLYLDAVPSRLLRQTALPVCHWIERMNHPDPDSFGDWLPGDALPLALRPLCELIGRDAVPIVLDIVRAFETWADDNAATAGPLPRVVGLHASTLRGVSFDRITTPYTLWMVQRVLDVYRRLAPPERAIVDRALAGTGCERLFAYVPRWRVERRPFRLMLERAGGTRR